MPELPDVAVYIEALQRRTLGQPLQQARITNPFLLRSVDPPIDALYGRPVQGFRRLGKRIVFDFGDELFLVLHLMIAGRLHWRPPGAKLPGRRGLAAFDFPDGTLTLTEAGIKRRASLYVVAGQAALAEHDPGGLEVLSATKAAFAKRLTGINHTVKRALTDPRLFSGIGNAYSDEILHAARLSPVLWTQRLDADQVAGLYKATRAVLRDWTRRLAAEAGDDFPEGVTAFRDGMAVHGRFRRPCPDCGNPVQRIAYATNETNYCAACQTGGKVLADRSLSRLLRGDWPRTLEELEELRPAAPGPAAPGT